MKGNLSIIHFNSRSLNCNISKIKDYFNQFKENFTIIAVSETWIKNEELDELQIEGYDLYNINKRNKKGGGVAFYINSSLRCKVVDNMTVVVDNIIELITVEIMRNQKMPASLQGMSSSLEGSYSN